MQPAIRVENLSKIYRINHQGVPAGADLRETLTHLIKTPWHRLRNGAAHTVHSEEFWALNDVSFEVQQGEILGVIGRNGAGKSTLLKILSQIMEPTRGRAEIRGRVGSLLEVGTGFHPELSGRENVYLNGAILGMAKRDIDRKFEAIVEFSGVEKFLDTPVKRYSSGMRVRLGFAVAAHLEPEILIVDEVLAVGDAAFQNRCINKMQDVSRSGNAVLFVSHNLASIRTLCTRVILLRDGQLSDEGEPSAVMDRYLTTCTDVRPATEMNLETWPNRKGGGGACILSARVMNAEGRVDGLFRRGDTLVVEFEMRIDEPTPLHLSAVCCSQDGTPLMHLSHFDSPGFDPGSFGGKAKVRFCVENLPLCVGEYNWNLHVQTDRLKNLDTVRGVLPFRTEDALNSRRPFQTRRENGLIAIPSVWEISRAYTANETGVSKPAISDGANR